MDINASATAFDVAAAGLPAQGRSYADDNRAGKHTGAAI
jgi:hypothetical protein